MDDNQEGDIANVEVNPDAPAEETPVEEDADSVDSGEAEEPAEWCETLSQKRFELKLTE